MTTLEINTQNKPKSSWFQRAPWLILVLGTAVALTVTTLLVMAVMKAPLSDLRELISTLSLTSLLSLGLGYLMHKRGWTRSTTVSRTLMIGYIWAALLTIFNVGIMQQQMFVNEHDLVLSTVLLLFAAIIATAFGIFAAASITDGLRQLAHSTQELASGNLETRVIVNGRDEVAQVGYAFNKMAAQLQQGEHQREEVERMRRDLIAWTSHDLRTPLTSIRVRVEALNDGIIEDDATRQRYYRDIRSDVLALNNLIDDLFELAQLDARGMTLEKSNHDLHDLVSDSLESFQAVAERSNIALKGRVSPEIGLVPLNPTKFSRVLGNLISNAIRHTPAGGTVWVRANSISDGVQILVQDTGSGFDPEDLPRIFEQFFRGEEARSRATGGAGLGLAIAKGIIEAHNGRIWAKNRPEGGAEIGLVLPVISKQ